MWSIFTLDYLGFVFLFMIFTLDFTFFFYCSFFWLAIFNLSESCSQRKTQYFKNCYTLSNNLSDRNRIFSNNVQKKWLFFNVGKNNFFTLYKNKSYNFTLYKNKKLSREYWGSIKMVSSLRSVRRTFFISTDRASSRERWFLVWRY